MSPRTVRAYRPRKVEIGGVRFEVHRFRHGCGEVRVSHEPTTDIMQAVGGRVIAHWESGDIWDGVCGWDDVVAAMADQDEVDPTPPTRREADDA